MSSQGVATTIVYMAYNTSTGAYTTGDSANHTLKLVKDGTEASPTNSPSEVDSTNAPGAYKLTLTASETSFGTVWCGGKSSTSNVIIIPITLTFELLPTALSSNSNVKADVEDLVGGSSGATNLSKTTNAIPRGTVTTGASTTSIPTSALSIAGSSATGVVLGQFVGRIVLFDGNTTTAGLRGASSVITASTASNTPTLTVGTLPATPASGDTFSIV